VLKPVPSSAQRQTGHYTQHAGNQVTGGSKYISTVANSAGWCKLWLKSSIIWQPLIGVMTADQTGASYVHRINHGLFILTTAADGFMLSME
jgi:hypothetical protein